MAFANAIVERIRSEAGAWTGIQTFEDGCLLLEDDDASHVLNFALVLTGDVTITFPDNDLDLSALDTTDVNFLGDLVAAGVTVAELDKLDGFTGAATDLEKLKGYTGTVTELNWLKTLYDTGVTTGELDKLDGFTGGVTELNYLKSLYDTGVTDTEFDLLDGLTSSAADRNRISGYTGTSTELNWMDTLHATGVTDTEFDYLDGSTENIQTAIDLVKASLMIGDANKEFVVCIPIGAGNRADTDNYTMEASAAGYPQSNRVTDNSEYVYILPLPVTRGGLKLYVDAMYCFVDDASATDYIADNHVKGSVGGTTTNINTDGTNYQTAGVEIQETFTTHDCSGYEYVIVVIDLIVANAYSCDWFAPRLRCYYDT